MSKKDKSEGPHFYLLRPHFHTSKRCADQLVDRLDGERENFCAAFRWAVKHHRPKPGGGAHTLLAISWRPQRRAQLATRTPGSLGLRGRARGPSAR